MLYPEREEDLQAVRDGRRRRDAGALEFVVVTDDEARRERTVNLGGQGDDCAA